MSKLSKSEIEARATALLEQVVVKLDQIAALDKPTARALAKKLEAVRASILWGYSGKELPHRPGNKTWSNADGIFTDTIRNWLLAMIIESTTDRKIHERLMQGTKK